MCRCIDIAMVHLFRNDDGILLDRSSAEHIILRRNMDIHS